MKRALLFITVVGLSFSCFTGNVQAQDNKPEVYIKEHIPSKKPVPYPYMREADVMWSKIVWRIIDLREKMNMPLYYPTKMIDKRMNLISLILFGIDNEGIVAYSKDDPLNEFNVQITKELVDEAMGAKTDTFQVPDVNTGEMKPKIVTKERQLEAVKQFLIKEKWFFDKQHSTMQVRILGICPILIQNKEDPATGQATEEIEKKQAFWVYYPEIRNLLANHEVYNRFNDAQNVSFDDIFLQRRFASYIFKESNVYNNRLIGDFQSGIETLYESERIKESLFNMEHDLWEY
jgi:gliding motility associated protien GldN